MDPLQNTKRERGHFKSRAKSIWSPEVWSADLYVSDKTEGIMVRVLEEERGDTLNVFIVLDTTAKEAKHSGFVIKCFSMAPILFLWIVFMNFMWTQTNWQLHLSEFRDHFQRDFKVNLKFLKLALNCSLYSFEPSQVFLYLNSKTNRKTTINDYLTNMMKGFI